MYNYDIFHTARNSTHICYHRHTCQKNFIAQFLVELFNKVKVKNVAWTYCSHDYGRYITLRLIIMFNSVYSGIQKPWFCLSKIKCSLSATFHILKWIQNSLWAELFHFALSFFGLYTNSFYSYILIYFHWHWNHYRIITLPKTQSIR